jgi:hypothetical protein
MRPGEALAGLLAAASIFMSFVGVVYRPLRILPFTMLLGLIATAFGGRHERLATAAVVIAAVCWVVGMTIAVLAGNAIY